MDPSYVLWLLGMVHLDEEEDDDYCAALNVLMQTKDPSDILPICKGLKEEGNILFRKNWVRNAFCKYNEGVKLLCCASPQKEEDNTLLYDLAISLNLNLAICALKLKEFARAKDLCSLVLELDPSNVKALYRRAISSKELDEFCEAFDDLDRAVNLDSKNGDVLQEMNNVKMLMDMRGMKQVGYDSFKIEDRKGKRIISSVEVTSSSRENPLCANSSDISMEQGERNYHESMEYKLEPIPVGLGIGLPPLTESFSKKDKEEDDVEMKDVKVQTSCSKEVIGEESSQDSSNYDLGKHTASVINESMESSEKKGIDYYDGIEADVQEASSTTGLDEVVSSMTGKDYMEIPSSRGKSGLRNASLKEKFDHVEPKYRFGDRRRQGSILTLPKKVYEAISKGNSFTYYNKKSSSFMEIRIVNNHKEVNNPLAKIKKRFRLQKIPFQKSRFHAIVLWIMIWV